MPDFVADFFSLLSILLTFFWFQETLPEEQRGLLNDLEACASPRTCPHGRPTMIHLSVSLLEQQFGRKGAR